MLLAGLGKRADAEQHYRKAMTLQEKLASDFPAVPEYRRELATSHNNLGIVLKNLGKSAEAEQQYRQALALQEKLASDFPAVPLYRSDQAHSRNNLGSLLRDLGKGAEAEQQYRRALALQEKLAADFPAVPEYRRDLASSYNNLGGLLAGLGKRPEAEQQYRKALALREKLAADFPAVPECRRDLAVSYNNLGLLLAGLGKRAEAEQHYRQALALYEKLAADFPAVPEYHIHLGSTYGNFGNLIAAGSQPGKSLEHYAKAIRTLTAVYEQEPRLVQAKRFLRNSHMGRARAYDRLHKYAEALPDWDRAVALSPPQEQPGLRAERALARLNTGQVAEAIAEVVELMKLPGVPAPVLYNFACVYAVASGKNADKKQEYADRAMDLLRQAVKAGWKDAAHMKKDTDLDSLRGREDFKKLLQELEGKAAPGPEKQP
jgi:tetratricopeptide (TPR) repeat protein